MHFNADQLTRAKDTRLRWGGLTSPEGHSELSCFPLPLLDVSQMNTDEKHNSLLHHSVFCPCPLRGKLHCLSKLLDASEKNKSIRNGGGTPVSSTQAHTFYSFSFQTKIILPPVNILEEHSSNAAACNGSTFGGRQSLLANRESKETWIAVGDAQNETGEPWCIP